MTNQRRILFLTICIGMSACGRSDTMLPIATSKAESTSHFPKPWDGPLVVEPPEKRVPSILMPKPGKTTRPNSIALVIGIETYRGELQPAVGAEADARLFADFAEKTLGLPRQNIHLLLGSAATKSSIDAQTSEWLPRNAKASGEVFVYFAGHGAPDVKTQSSYLMPWDADPIYIATQGIAKDPWVHKLSQLKSGSVFVFLDACFSGAGGRSVVPAGSRPVVLGSLMSAPSQSDRLVLMNATGPNEVTGMASTGNGLFSYYLFLGLNGAADGDADSVVTTDELAQYVTSNVADESERQGRHQKPQTEGLTANSKKRPLAEQLKW